MKTILEYLNTNKMLEDPINVPKGLFPTYYIGLDRDFEIDIRTKIIEEVETIKALQRQLEEAREDVKKAVRQGFDALCDGGFYPITFDEFWARSEFNKLKEN